jgi:hypothetical protein
MPSINLAITPHGPLVSAIIMVSGARRAALTAAGLAVPPAQPGIFLIDTGASCTCIDSTFLAPLGLTPTGSSPMLTPSTNGVPHQCSTYDCTLLVPNGTPSQPAFLVDPVQIVETSFSGQNIVGLIGRDILSRCTLFYNGSMGHYTLSY